jgi:hypothetical protein
VHLVKLVGDTLELGLELRDADLVAGDQVDEQHDDGDDEEEQYFDGIHGRPFK